MAGPAQRMLDIAQRSASASSGKRLVEDVLLLLMDDRTTSPTHDQLVFMRANSAPTIRTTASTPSAESLPHRCPTKGLLVSSIPVILESTDQMADFQVRIDAQGPSFLADEPADLGGNATGPTPYDLLSAALGACTAMTIRLYARKKRIALRRVQIAVRHGRAEDGSESFRRTIHLDGTLTREQIETLMAVADRCPVGKTLHQGAAISSEFSAEALAVETGGARDCDHVAAIEAACEEFDRTG
jgi:putative redox protein